MEREINGQQINPKRQTTTKRWDKFSSTGELPLCRAVVAAPWRRRGFRTGCSTNAPNGWMRRKFISRSCKWKNQNTELRHKIERYSSQESGVYLRYGYGLADIVKTADTRYRQERVAPRSLYFHSNSLTVRRFQKLLVDRLFRFQ